MTKKQEESKVVVKVDPKIEEVDKKVKALAKIETPTREIKTQDEYDRVAKTLLDIKAFKQRINDVFKPMLAAAKATTKAIDTEYKKHIEPVEALDEKLRLVSSAWITKQEAKRIAEQEKLDKKRDAKIAKIEQKNAEREAKGLEVKDDFVPVVQAEAVQTSGISFRKVYRFEIIDESLIPDDYFIVDEVAIGKAVREAKGEITIPGVKVIIDKVPMV